MKYVGMRQLKTQLARYLRTVQAGESLTVTVHNRPVARVIPILPQGQGGRRNDDFIGGQGLLRLSKRKLRQVRRVLKIRNVRIADAVLEDRGATDA
jgi:prevent-host-death family protein